MRLIVVGPSGMCATVMRFLVLPILAVGAFYTAAPSQAQTYDPNYPVCLQIYDDMVHYYFECSYTSMAQCQASASGRAAQCVVNPFPAKAYTRPGSRHKRSHRHKKIGSISRS